jgi:hypothetical protein
MCVVFSEIPPYEGERLVGVHAQGEVLHLPGCAKPAGAYGAVKGGKGYAEGFGDLCRRNGNAIGHAVEVRPPAKVQDAHSLTSRQHFSAACRDFHSRPQPFGQGMNFGFLPCTGSGLAVYVRAM